MWKQTGSTGTAPESSTTWGHSRTLAHARVLTARLQHQPLGDAITGGCWRISVLGTQAFRGRGALPLARQCAPVARSGWVKGTGMAQHASRDRLWPVSWMAVSDRFNVWREKFGKLDVQTLCAGFVRGIAEFAGLPSSRGIDAFRVIRRRQA
jgi:hypothetical protein